MYKLFKFLFGWDYIYWNNSADQGIARVHLDQLGNPYYYRYPVSQLIDKIINPEDVIWLTCHPDKFAPSLNESEGNS